MKSLYFDLIGGASGDMILAALIDAGLPAEDLKRALTALNLDEFKLEVSATVKNGFSATRVDVQVGPQPPERHLNQILEVIEKSSLSDHIKERAAGIFTNIASVEAGIHGKEIDDVHLHELGGTDTIVDVTGALLGLEILGVDRVYSSPIPLGSGFIDGAHGKIPLPAPATLALLTGLPVRGTDISKELVTPTGAALLADLVDSFKPAPEMEISSIGYGAGSRDLPIPNLLRVIIGEEFEEGREGYQNLAMLSTNLDDLNPEIYPYVMEKLFEAGALDVTLQPVQMKKGRPGTQIEVLAELQKAEVLRDILFRETTTLGVRQIIVERYCLPRESEDIETPYGTISVKVARFGSQIKVSPEFEDCQRIAKKHNLPILQIYQEAIQAYHENS